MRKKSTHTQNYNEEKEKKTMDQIRLDSIDSILMDLIKWWGWGW